MKNLKDRLTELVHESMFSADFADKNARDLKRGACIEWLRAHIDKDHPYLIDNIIKPNNTNNSGLKIDDNGVWHLRPNKAAEVVITLSKGDKWPESLEIASINAIKLIGYDGTEIPEPIKNIHEIDSFIIRNCPKLKSLNNCPTKTEKFAVSGCPNLKDISGCPKKVDGLFKFVNNGIKIDFKTIKKHCTVDKRNIIYDHD